MLLGREKCTAYRSVACAENRIRFSTLIGFLRRTYGLLNFIVPSFFFQKAYVSRSKGVILKRKPRRGVTLT